MPPPAPTDTGPPVLEFAVQAVEPDPPILRLTLGIEAGQRALQGLALKVRVQINAHRRRYSAEEASELWELFGPVEQWSRSLGPIPWTSVAVGAGPFTSSTRTELRLPTEFEPEDAAGKYLAALHDGVVPLELLFSGTLSWTRSDGPLQSAMIPWDCEAIFRMPLATWRQAVR